MKKFFYCFPSIFQFSCPAIVIALFTPWLGYHILHQTLSFFVGLCFFAMYFIVYKLAFRAYDEMIQDFADYNESNKE